MNPAADVVERVANVIEDSFQGRPTLVAVDGADSAGKTTFADALAHAVGRKRPVIRVEGDDFEQPRQFRYQRGPASAQGYFEDTYDYEALAQRLLIPLLEGDRRIVRRIYNRSTDEPVHDTPEDLPVNGVVIVDGCFLLREDLRRYWTIAVYLEVTEAERLRRAMDRDLERLGGIEGVTDRYRTRYFPGFQLYVERHDPASHADVVIENSDVTRPRLIRWFGTPR